MSIHSYTNVKNLGYFSLENWTDVIFSRVCFRYTFVNSTVSITTGKEIPRSFRLNDLFTVKVKLNPWQKKTVGVEYESAWLIAAVNFERLNAILILNLALTQAAAIYAHTWHSIFLYSKRFIEISDWLFHVNITVYALISKFKNVIAYMYIITLV